MRCAGRRNDFEFAHFGLTRYSPAPWARMLAVKVSVESASCLTQRHGGAEGNKEELRQLLASEFEFDFRIVISAPLRLCVRCFSIWLSERFECNRVSESHQIPFAWHFTPWISAATLTAFDVRWWSVAHFGRRRTGNPVRFRDGPAAVTEHNLPSFLLGPLFAEANEKAAEQTLGSQKTYQRVACESAARAAGASVGFLLLR